MWMRTLSRIVVVVLCLTAALTAQTQNLVGQWQGTLAFQGKELRLVFVLAASGQGNTLSATLYSIDQAPNPIPATITVQGGAVRIAVAVAGITFDGKLSPDNNSIVGTFTQGPGSTPLTLVRATGDAAFPIPAPPKSLAADAPMTFEVATIKPSDPARPSGPGITMRPPDVVTFNTTLGYLMGFAYDVHARQIDGGSPWVESEKYDIVGRPQAAGVPSLPQFRALLRNLIEDRFQLKTHREKRNLPAYAVVVGSNGPKMSRNETNPNGPPGAGGKGLGVMVFSNATMGDFATVMQGNILDRPVVDRTGLQGRFDFTLSWTPDESQYRQAGIQVPPAPADAKLPGLFTAIQEQIGLRFESVTAPVEVVVIDGAEKPTN
jgi:uncharacterized protein (TIGR03435 family)